MALLKQLLQPADLAWKNICQSGDRATRTDREGG
jgi:hypothetical protein